jgi:hypothetical protein
VCSLARFEVEGGDDVGEDTVDAAGQKLQRGDQGDADQSDNQGVLDQRLALFAVVADPAKDANLRGCSKSALVPPGVLVCH